MVATRPPFQVPHLAPRQTNTRLNSLVCQCCSASNYYFVIDDVADRPQPCLRRIKDVDEAQGLRIEETRRCDGDQVGRHSADDEDVPVVVRDDTVIVPWFRHLANFIREADQRPISRDVDESDCACSEPMFLYTRHNTTKKVDFGCRFCDTNREIKITRSP